MSDKVSLITGSAQGIGRQTAKKFAKEGMKLALVDVKKEKLQELEEELDEFEECITVECDVSDPKQVKKTVSKTVDEFGKLDILVNNAGVMSHDQIEEVTDELLEKILGVNFKGTFYFCREVAPIMKSNSYGKIVNVSSIAGKTGDNTTTPVYGSSKGAIATLTKSLARQLGPFGINVNGVAPHAIMTPMMSYWDEEKKERIRNSLPVRRLGTPKDVAMAISFLASDEADFITGQIINVNGGELME